MSGTGPDRPVGGGDVDSGDRPVVVFLVDDQPMIGEAVRRALASQADISFHYCADANEALATAELLQPTVILQDLVMPGVDGLSLVGQYRDSEFTKDVPVIVLSSLDDPSMKSRAFAANVNDYLVKLPDSVELIARIRHHSRAYTTLLERDEAFRALADSQRALLELNLVLQELSKKDRLTGLSNRRHLDEVLESEWSRAIRSKTTVSVLMIDVDYFKKYNDSLGHLAGDEVLKAIARELERSLGRTTDFVARFGGEEFAMVLPGTGLSGARHVAETICQKIEALAMPHLALGSGAIVTVSVGSATTIPQLNAPSSCLIEAADHALYESKKNGRNRATVREL